MGLETAGEVMATLFVFSKAVTKDFAMGLEIAGEVMAKLIVCSTAMTEDFPWARRLLAK